MKKIKTVVFLSLAFIFSFLVYSLYHMTNAGNDGRNIESPLPHFLTKNFPFASVENNLWEPVISATNQSFDKKLKVTAASAVSYDLTTNRILQTTSPRGYSIFRNVQDPNTWLRPRWYIKTQHLKSKIRPDTLLTDHMHKPGLLP